MTKMWAPAGTEGWWKAHGWKEICRVLRQDVEEVLLEHEEDVDVEEAFYGEKADED